MLDLKPNALVKFDSGRILFDHFQEQMAIATCLCIFDRVLHDLATDALATGCFRNSHRGYSARASTACNHGRAEQLTLMRPRDEACRQVDGIGPYHRGDQRACKMCWHDVALEAL